MEDLNKLLQLSESYPVQLEQLSEEFLLKLRVIFWGQAAIEANKAKIKDLQKPTEGYQEQTKDLPLASPQQQLKRVKRLSSLNEDNEVEVIDNLEDAADKNSSPRKCKRSNAELLAAVEAVKDDAIVSEAHPVAAPRTLCVVSDFSNNENDINQTQEILKTSEEISLMPPPPVPSVDESVNKRPQRAAKIKSEKCLKEPTLKGKLRRATNEVKVKLEHEQRVSQIHADASESSKLSVLKESNENVMAKSSMSSERSNDSVCIIPGKQPSVVSINSDTEDVLASTDDGTGKQSTKGQKKNSDSTGVREVCVKIKREKVSLENQENFPQNSADEAVFKLPAPKPFVKDETLSKGETSLANSILSTTSNATTKAPANKIRKKKDVVHRPIKVERFSDLNSKPSISTRTRQATNKQETIATSQTTEATNRPKSVYEDAVNALPNRNSKEINMNSGAGGNANQTVDLGPAADATMNLGAAPNDATYCTNPAQTTFQVAPSQTTFVLETNPNATITLNKQSGSGAPVDVTFDVHQVSKTGKDKEDEGVGNRSFETAKDSSLPNENSLLTEDEEEKPTATKPKTSTMQGSAKVAPKTSSSAKAAYKMPTRANELFNPLAQSPVKLRVEAFENAAAAATEQSKRPLRIRKENATPTTTPVIGKLTAPSLGRFLTPTQTSNLTAANSSISKKATTSASKALPISKLVTASSLQRSNSTASAKTLNRENSGDDFRKGLHTLAEERKKQREQKHLLAAQQREAKERERTERMAKLAKEREEKRKLKKQQEQEQKKRELEEIQRKLRQQKEEEEEAAKIKAAKEREMLLQMKQQQQLPKQKMLPPPPKTASKYTFEMLHEDDSTDDEDKVSYKRPSPPSWSRSHVRGPFMLKQEYTPTAYIDSFFSVQPMTPDLKIIFPNIDARHLKRNSSVLWSTPPRYSELPKY